MDAPPRGPWVAWPGSYIPVNGCELKSERTKLLLLLLEDEDEDRLQAELGGRRSNDKVAELERRRGDRERVLTAIMEDDEGARRWCVSSVHGVHDTAGLRATRHLGRRMQVRRRGRFSAGWLRAFQVSEQVRRGGGTSVEVQGRCLERGLGTEGPKQG